MPRPLHLIYIEDNADDLELVLHHLQSGGFEVVVTQAQTAQELRAALGRTGWDAVISDYNLPAFNAREALSIVHASGQDLPFIVVTGTIGEERAVEMMRAGADDFVLKDQLGRLTAAIDRSIGDARVRTDRERAVSLLRTMNQELSTLVDAAPMAIIAVNASSKVRSWNPTAERLLGWSAAETVGGDLPPLASGDARDLDAMREQVQDGRIFTAVATQLRSKDGCLVDVSLSMAPLGPQAGFLLIAEDTSEQRRLEAMLMHSQKMEAIGILAGGVAHDFNNLLAVILGFGELILSRSQSQDRVHRPAEEICRAADRARALTQQLLAFSRKQIIRPQVIELNEVIRQMDGMLRRLIGEQIALDTTLVDASTAVTCDPNQIEMAIMNLAVNARDAMSGGGTLAISTGIVELAGDEPLARGTLAPGRYLVITVADSGTGMDAATQARIFEPFFTTKERGRGTGLGLATVFGVVRQSGGHIGVSSEPQRGTTFTIHLPLAEPRKELEEALPSRRTEIRGTETILVVEDEDALRDLLETYLREHGYEVLSAANAERALEHVRVHPGAIDLLVTDVVLPGLNGVALAQSLFARYPGLRVLYMSGYTGSDQISEDLAMNAQLLEKPFRPQVLLARIRETLGSAA